MAHKPKRMTRSAAGRCFSELKELSILLDPKEVEKYFRLVRNASGEWQEKVFVANANTANVPGEQKSGFTVMENVQLQRPSTKNIHKKFGFRVSTRASSPSWPKSPNQSDWVCTEALPWTATYKYLLSKV